MIALYEKPLFCYKLFMLEFHDLAILFLAFLVILIKPGPEMLAFSSMAIKGDWRSIIIFWLGTTTGGTTLYFGILLTLSAIPENFGIIFIFIKSVAALIFVGMGLTGIQEAKEIPNKEAEEKIRKISMQTIFFNFTSGFLLTLGNPYVIIFVVTAVPALMNRLSFSVMDVVLIRSTVVFADILVLCAYCIPLFIVRKKIPEKYIQSVRFYTSLAMLGIGIFLIGNILLQFDLVKTNLINVF